MEVPRQSVPKLNFSSLPSNFETSNAATPRDNTDRSDRQMLTERSGDDTARQEGIPLGQQVRRLAGYTTSSGHESHPSPRPG